MRKKSITIAVFIDALGWRLARDHDFLRSELPRRGPLATTFGYSSTCDPTILSGLKPREHGHFAFFTFDPENSPFKKLWWPRVVPAFLTQRGRIRRWMSNLVRRHVRYTGYFQLYNTPFELLSQLDYTEKRDLYGPHALNGGQATLFDDLRSANVPYHVSNWRLDEETNLSAARRDIATGQPEFAYVFLAQLDAILHAEGTRSTKVTDKLRCYERQVRELLNLAHDHYDHVSLSVLSDHGMTDVRKECPLMAFVDALPLEFGKDYFAVYDSTMARFWFLNQRAESVIGHALESHPDGHWLSEETLRLWGCDFPGRRYGHRFFLLNPGVLLNPSFMGQFALAGMHGYDPSHEDSTAFFATNDPHMQTPRSLEDIRSSLSNRLGLDRIDVAA
jgi:hypothetical protein